MGDISEIRPLIVVVSFLGGLFILLSLVPPQFYTAGDFRDVTPIDLEGVDVYSYADFANTAMNETGGWIYPLDTTWYIVEIDDGDGDFGGHDLDMWYKRANESTLEIRHEHLYGWFIFTFSHDMDHYDKAGVKIGTYLDVSDIENNKDQNNFTSRFKIKCYDFSATAIYNFNLTRWNNFTDAWNHNELYVFHGIYFDDIGTSYNSFDLIARLLFFQLPDMNPILNAFIAIPLWVCISYLIYVLIIKVIPLIAGG